MKDSALDAGPDWRRADFIRRQTAPAAPSAVPELVLHLAQEVTPLWQATESDLERSGIEPPFWAFAWPGGQALARFLLDRPELARGRRVLDLAAGSGIAAIAAARAGACDVAASEIEPLAAAAIALNAALNGVAVVVLDHDLLSAPPAGPGGFWDLILAGDVCYERKMAERVITWLRAAAREGAEILLSDPGRAYLPSAGLTLLARYAVPTSLDLENRTLMETSVYRLAAE